MKTEAQIKFDTIIKKGFQEVLKPLGFKKKANNFYLQLPEVGHIIYIQKSKWNTAFEISFTINIGIFEPKFWLKHYDYKKTGIVPNFPTEPESLIRKRIGDLVQQGDIWYEINKNTNENELIQTMQNNIHQFILPYLEKYNSVEKIKNAFETEEIKASTGLGALIFYAEYGFLEEAKKEYQKLYEKTMVGNPTHPFLKRLKTYGEKYGLG